MMASARPPEPHTHPQKQLPPQHHQHQHHAQPQAATPPAATTPPGSQHSLPQAEPHPADTPAPMEEDEEPEVYSRYHAMKVLGQGSSAIAVQCYDTKSDKDVCVKIYKNPWKHAIEEVEILQFLREKDLSSDNHILRIEDHFYDTNDHLNIVTPLYGMPADDMSAAVEGFFAANDMMHLRTLMRHLLSALLFLDSIKVIHCDVKPENLLVLSTPTIPCCVTLIDFGLAIFHWTSRSAVTQTRQYRSPEVILGLPYDSKIDIWSAGCVAMEMATGRRLMRGETVADHVGEMYCLQGPFPPHMVQQGRFSSQYFAPNDTTPLHQISSRLTRTLQQECSTIPVDQQAPFIEFVARLLCMDPCQRLDARSALDHPWLKG